MLLPYQSIYPIRRSVELNLPSIDRTISHTYNVINCRDRAVAKLTIVIDRAGKVFQKSVKLD
jgi:hypothetical protein